MGVGDGVFIDQSMIFFDESSTEFGCNGGFLDGESFGFAEEDLAEIGDVAIDGAFAVFGDVHDLTDGFSFEEKQFADLFLVGEGWAHVVDGAASRE